MVNFDIDELKSEWQKQKTPIQYDEKDIRSMLNRRSRNYVKYIFLVSVAEFLVFILINSFYFFKEKSSDSYFNILERLGVRITSTLENSYEQFYLSMQGGVLLVTSFFVVVFYLKYKKINVEEDLKRFILKIIAFRKSVDLFISINILLLITYVVLLFVFTFEVLSEQNISLHYRFFYGLIIGGIVSLVLCVFLIYAYYRLVYGMFMRRLGKNLKQLKEIENDHL